MSRELLREALVIWRETRADAIAEIIERLTGELSRGWAPPVVKLARAFHATWLAAAVDDVHRGWAAQHVTDQLPDRKALRDRVLALLAAGPDPRVDVDKLRALGVDVPVQPPAIRSPTQAELARFAPPVQTIDQASLERDVHANPDDDAPRAVLADLLQSQGDPRGELIALQLANTGDDRIVELLRDHGRFWLGPLNAKRAEFRRGFLTRLELARAEPWERVIDHPLLGTVEDLVAGDASGEQYAELMESPAMSALRRIDVGDLTVAAALERAPAGLVHIGFPTELLDVVVRACARFEKLRSVACRLADVPQLMRSPIGSKLTSLTVTGELSAALAFWKNFRRPIQLVIAPHARLPDCGAVEGSIRARWDDKQLVIRVEGPWAAAICNGDFERLLPCDRLEVVEPVLGARFDHLKVEIVRIPQPSRAGVISAIGK